MESYPKFHNEVGVPIVRIGCREFKCIEDKPPQDHPHTMGSNPHWRRAQLAGLPSPIGSEREERS
jgi:hypothetical protein